MSNGSHSRGATSDTRHDRRHAHAAAAQAAIDALLAVRRALRVAEQRPASDVGLPAAQLAALHILSDVPARDTLSLGDLARRLHVDPSSASVVVDRLVELGLAVRREGAPDRRRTDLRATAAGRRLARRAASETGPLHAAVAALAPGTVRELGDALGRLRTALLRERGPRHEA